MAHALLFLRFLAVDLIGSVVYFPLWWYSAGLLQTASWCVQNVAAGARSLALGVWVKNLFVPMYGQRDVSGRIISFFMRLIMIILYSILLLFLMVMMLIVFALWVALPVFAGYQLYLQAVGLMA